VHLDPRLPQARAHLGNVLLFKRRYDAAIAEFEPSRSIPISSTFDTPEPLRMRGEPARAIEALEANIRHDPFPWAHAFGSIGCAYYYTCSNAMGSGAFAPRMQIAPTRSAVASSYARVRLCPVGTA
jgi:hypothetical protein